jgi:hypothetical protein
MVSVMISSVGCGWIRIWGGRKHFSGVLTEREAIFNSQSALPVSGVQFGGHR